RRRGVAGPGGSVRLFSAGASGDAGCGLRSRVERGKIGKNTVRSETTEPTWFTYGDGPRSVYGGKPMLRYKVLAGIGGRGVARGGKMHSKGLMASGFALVVLLLMAMAAPSGAASIPCGEVGPEGGEIKGNVTVVQNGHCGLSGVTVDGNVTVDRGSQ